VAAITVPAAESVSASRLENMMSAPEGRLFWNFAPGFTDAGLRIAKLGKDPAHSFQKTTVVFPECTVVLSVSRGRVVVLMVPRTDCLSAVQSGKKHYFRKKASQTVVPISVLCWRFVSTSPGRAEVDAPSPSPSKISMSMMHASAGDEVSRRSRIS
jgi:hypothetical protein